MAGDPRALRGDVLPTEAEIYKHYLHVQVAKESSGEWHRSVPVSTKIKKLKNKLNYRICFEELGSSKSLVCQKNTHIGFSNKCFFQKAWFFKKQNLCFFKDLRFVQ